LVVEVWFALGLENRAFKGVERRSVIPFQELELEFAFDPVAFVKGFLCLVAFGVSPPLTRLPCTDKGALGRSTGSAVPVETSP